MDLAGSAYCERILLLFDIADRIGSVYFLCWEKINIKSRVLDWEKYRSTHIGHLLFAYFSLYNLGAYFIQNNSTVQSLVYESHRECRYCGSFCDVYSHI